MPAFFLIMLNLLLFVSLVYSNPNIITTPTSTNGTHQYFDTISSINSYQFDKIVCSTANCHIICDVDAGCYSTEIDASLSNVLTIKCTTDSACESLFISGEPSQTLDLYCGNNIQACASAIINLPTTSNINIICNYSSSTTINGACYDLRLTALQSTAVNIECMGQYSCTSANFSVNNQPNIINELNVSCGYYSCFALSITTYQMDGKVNLRCNDYYSCYTMDLYTADMTSRYFYIQF